MAQSAPITDEDIAALQSVLDSLKAGAREAKGKGNLTVFLLYQKLIKIVSPQVTNAHERKERQELARINKDGQALRKTPFTASSPNP